LAPRADETIGLADQRPVIAVNRPFTIGFRAKF
jgi:hypothetical protein